METMGTEQLLDLFSNKPAGGKDGSGSTSKSSNGMKSILESLPELWEHKQYEDEYDLSQFISKLE